MSDSLIVAPECCGSAAVTKNISENFRSTPEALLCEWEYIRRVVRRRSQNSSAAGPKKPTDFGTDWGLSEAAGTLRGLRSESKTEENFIILLKELQERRALKIQQLADFIGVLSKELQDLRAKTASEEEFGDCVTGKNSQSGSAELPVGKIIQKESRVAKSLQFPIVVDSRSRKNTEISSASALVSSESPICDSSSPSIIASMMETADSTTVPANAQIKQHNNLPEKAVFLAVLCSFLAAIGAYV